MDLITSLPASARGQDAIAVFVDRLSKRVHLAPVDTSITAPQLARVFVDTVVKHHGVPEIIVSDRDPRFVSDFWGSLFRLLGTQLNISTAFHPQTDGQTERTNRQLEQVLRHYVNAQHTNWDELLAIAEFSINSHVSAATGFTPFFLTRACTLASHCPSLHKAWAREGQVTHLTLRKRPDHPSPPEPSCRSGTKRRKPLK